MKAKTLDSSMLTIESDQPEPAEPQPPALTEDIINTMKSNHSLQNLIPRLNDLLASASKDTFSKA